MKLHTTNSAPEMIWRGRMHIGDEPGVFGDAVYAGLATELPVTLTNYGKVFIPEVTFEVTAEGASRFGAPYVGHKITVSALTQISATDPPVWQRKTIGEGILDSDSASVTVRIEPGTRYVGIRVEADLTVTPGFYDDFILTSASLIAAGHYADFGFRS